MKKIIFAFFCFVAALAATVSATDTLVIATGKTNADVLNMRLGPGIQQPVVGKIPGGTEVQITGKVGNWLEIKAPESLKIYVSEARVNPDGTLVGELNMRSQMSVTAPCFGTLPKNTKVTRLDEHANGWVRIVPPANIRVFVSAFCVDFDRNKIEPEKKPAETQAAPEVQAAPETKAAPEVKKTVENKHTVSGFLILWKFSRSKETTYALLDAPEGRNQTFVVAENPDSLTGAVDKKVTVSGDYISKTDAGASVFHANTVTIVQ